MRTVLVAILALLTAAVAVPLALAATKHGITPVAPKPGATVATGSSPVFKGRVSGPGKVFVYVSKSPKRGQKGLIGRKEMIQEAKRTKTRFKVKARFFDYPGFWLNSPGTYYWQAHRIACEDGDTRDCNQEGSVVKLKVG